MRFLQVILFFVLSTGFIQAQTAPDKDQLKQDWQEVQKLMDKQMAEMKQFFSESFGDDFFKEMPFRDTAFIKQFDFGDQLGEINTEDFNQMMQEMHRMLQEQMGSIDMQGFWDQLKEMPAIPAPDQLDENGAPLQNEDEQYKPRKKRPTQSL
ncbi:MAG: hypothetical protein R2879_10090 [Saprospiraceae bacterium]